MGDYDGLENLWKTISPEKVYGPRRAWRILRRLYQGKPSLFPLEGIRRVVNMIDPAKMTIELRVGAVSLVSGAFKVYLPWDEHFKDALMATAALPLIFPPVHVGDEPSMIDGGVRNISPLGAVLDAEPDEIVVINCSSQASLAVTNPPTTALAISQRAFEIAMHEIFTKDIGKVVRMNKLVAQAEAQGATLRNSVGKRFRNIPVTIIEPEGNLGETTDFTQALATRAYAAGWEAAKKLLG
jgi:NTE family protein